MLFKQEFSLSCTAMVRFTVKCCEFIIENLSSVFCSVYNLSVRYIMCLSMIIVNESFTNLLKKRYKPTSLNETQSLLTLKLLLNKFFCKKKAQSKERCLETCTVQIILNFHLHKFLFTQSPQLKFINLFRVRHYQNSIININFFISAASSETLSMKLSLCIRIMQ